MAGETWTLDPAAVAAGRTSMNITSYIAAAGPDLGNAEISAYMADMQQFGASPVDYRIPNRVIKIPLSIRTVGTATFAATRTALQAKAALFQREGGWVSRVASGGTYYADVVNATLHFGGSWLQAFRDADVDATLDLECLPDWYGDEVTLSDHVETTAAELIFTEPSILGSYPARTRLVVDNDQVTDQHGLLWGFRSRNYSGSATAALAYEAEALGPLDAAAPAAHAGASGGTVMKHASLPGGAWCPVMSTNIGGTAFLTHKGSYRVWARCYSGTATPQLKFLWDVGDISGPEENDVVQLPGAANFYLLDLGQIRLDPAPIGSHRWQGVIQAQAATQGDSLEIDRLWFQPLDESAGKLTAVQQDSALGISVFRSPGTGADDASVGAFAWTNPGNVTAEDGNVATTSLFSGASHYLKATNYGFAIPTGATISGIQVDIKRAFDSGGFGTTVTDNRVRLVKAGAIQATDKADTVTSWPDGSALAFKSYGGATDLWGGAWTAADINNAGFGAVLSATVAQSSSTPKVDVIRIRIYYTTSGGFSTTADSVVYASRTAELRTEGMFRLDSTGVAYGPVSAVEGDLPRLPPSGSEARTTEVFVKMSRGDFASEPDAGIDDLSARITMRPSFLYLG